MIEILPYRSEWQREFAEIGARLRQALGTLAVRIDHIGSTSVPGLAAKDIVDIQVTVMDLDDPVERAVKGMGFDRIAAVWHDHVPPGASEAESEWAKWLFKAQPGQRPVNVHVRIDGRLNQRYPLLFRDYLRAHASIADAYARTKIALAHYHPGDMEAYYDVKDPVCDIIMGGAEEWAAATCWHQGASDA
jgi:GrpB-like predicted nucleotidyltransferase (UPF0157 family)